MVYYLLLLDGIPIYKIPRIRKLLRTKSSCIKPASIEVRRIGPMRLLFSLGQHSPGTVPVHRRIGEVAFRLQERQSRI